MIADKGLVHFPTAYLGVPIPIFYCDTCGKTIINDETISYLQEIFAAEGAMPGLHDRPQSFCRRDLHAATVRNQFLQRN